METVSETTKRKVGRPKSKFWETAKMLGSHGAEGCARTKLDYVRMIFILGAVQKDRSDEDQHLALGITKADFRSGKGTFAPGFRTMAVEACRWCEASGANRRQAANIIIDARRRGLSFPDLYAHFRRLRLGDRKGSKEGFLLAIERTVNDHLRRFSGTDRATLTGYLRE